MFNNYCISVKIEFNNNSIMSWSIQVLSRSRIARPILRMGKKMPDGGYEVFSCFFSDVEWFIGMFSA